MLAVKPAQQQLSVAARNAEALFEAKNVSEIRQIESRTRQDIEEKNLQLRQLVGDSYRDLIDGTDKIIDISTKCHSILGSILAIQESFASLAVSVSSMPGSSQDGKENVKKHRELHAVGARVKYAMDTPEVIWGCLDAQEHLEAARRLLRVHEVHDQLQAHFAALVAAKFPVLAHQWQTVLKFRHNILTSALTLLSTQPDLSSRTAADALAAVALLEKQDTAAALQCFLSARTQWVQQQLEQAAAAQGRQQEAPGAVLAQLAQSVQSCVAQVGELFTAAQAPEGAAPGSSLLQQVVREDDADASELYFGSADGKAEGSSSPEAVQWRQRTTAFCEQLSPLQREQVQQASSAWLSDIAASCRQHGLQLLQQCQDADGLLSAELAVHQAMADWSAAGGDEAAAAAAAAGTPDAAQGKGDDPLAAAAARLSRAASSAVAAAAAAAAAGSPSGSPTVRAALGRQQGRQASDWERVCQAVLGHKLDLWQVLFHAPFLERCQQLIAAALAHACRSIEEPLAAALEQAARHQPEAAGQLQPGSWPSISSASAHGADGAASGGMDRGYSLGVGVVGGSGLPGSTWSMPSTSLSRALSLLPAGSLGAEAGAAGFRDEVRAIQRLFDQQLHAALEAVLVLTVATKQQQQDAAGSKPRTPSRTSSLQPTASIASLLRAGSMQPGSPSAGPGLAAPTAAAAAAAAAGKQRAADLHAFAQQQCLQQVQQLAGSLQQQLQALPKPPPGLRGANDVEQVLLLARLCTALAAHSCILPTVLGPAEAWPAAVRAGPHAGPPGLAAAGSGAGGGLPASLAQGVGALGPAAAALLRMHHPGLAGQQHGQAAGASDAAARLAALQQRLHAVAVAGYGAWAAWVGASLAGELAAAMAADELLSSDATPLSWSEVKLAAEGGPDADASAAGLLELLDEPAAPGDMCFALPACPSAAVLQGLSRACWEVRRAGEHLITTDALQLLLWEVHGGALAVLQQLLQRSAAAASNGGGKPAGGAPHAPGALSEKGVLQLLFDQRLLRDVLGGGRPLPALLAEAGGAAAPAAAAAAAAPDAAARKRAVSGVEQQLQDLLDPIDWATYEPHLWAHAQRFHGRTAVLLGTLAQMSRPYPEAGRPAPGAAPSADINALNVLPVAPRLHYLPISTPSAAALPRGRRPAVSRNAGAAAAKALAGGGLLGGAAAAAAAAAAPGQQAQQQLPLASISTHASDLAAEYLISDASSAGAGGRAGGADQGGAAAAAAAAAPSFLQPSADAAAAAGASALSALQAKLQGSSFGAFGSMLGDRAAEVTAMAQNFGDLLPTAGGLGGLSQSAVGGLLSSFARRDGSAGMATGGGAGG